MLVAVSAFGAAPASACDVAASSSTTIGTYSSPAVQAQAVPYLRASGGFSCASNSIVTLLSGNYLKATIAAGSVLKLTSADTSDTVTVKVAADSAGTIQLTPGTQVTYMQNTTINVVGLLGSDWLDMPVYVKPTTAGPIAAGTYTGSFSVKWDWSFCKGLSALGSCLFDNTDSGSKSGLVKLTLKVEPRTAVMTITSSTTWDPVRQTNSPKAIPGGKLRLAITVTNPDIVALDANSLNVALPTPATLAIALDGDGTGSGGVVQLSQGTTPSTLTLAYAAPDNAADDVDFFCAGTGWSCAPTAGNAASQGAVTQVRFKPKGSMAPGSSFTVSLPYSVK
jgi:hypothetical protein